MFLIAFPHNIPLQYCTVLCNIVSNTLSYKLKTVKKKCMANSQDLYNRGKMTVLNSVFIYPLPETLHSLLTDLRRDTAHLLSPHHCVAE